MKWIFFETKNARGYLVTAKSEAITACIPSWPLIPIPMSAVWIMDTSLAPSPIANVCILSCSFTIRTRYAF